LAKLLVLSLAETTSDKDNGYAVIARNLDNDSWVIIPTLPRELFRIDGKYVWDIFAITEADIIRRFDNRSNVYDVNQSNYLPYMVQPPYKSNTQRREFLESLSFDSTINLQNSSSWVGILKTSKINELFFYERKQDDLLYDVNQTFYWECRIDFTDEYGYQWRYKKAPGIAVKDMRFKAYWRDLMISRKELFSEKKQKWIEYMKENDTYFLIEFYPSSFLGSVAVISGVLCINKKEMRRDS